MDRDAGAAWVLIAGAIDAAAKQLVFDISSSE
jgi:hypothetical protein